MRERNKNLVENIGELSKEIEQQDLENVNGGDAQVRSISDIVASAITLISATTIAKSNADKKCSAVFTLSAECAGGHVCK